MISVTERTYIPFDKIIESTDLQKEPNIILYPNLFSGQISVRLQTELESYFNIVRYYQHIPNPYIDAIKEGLIKLTGIPFDSCVVNGYPEFYSGRKAVVLFTNFKMQFTQKNTGKKVNMKLEPGSTFIPQKGFDEMWSYTLPKQFSLTFFVFNFMPLEQVYLSTYLRKKYASIIRDSLDDIRTQPIGKQCISHFIPFGNMIGRGDYGNVYSSKVHTFKFAVKLSKLKEGAVNNPYSRNNISWYEVLIMKKIFFPLITDNICPNLPLLIDSMVCDSCKLTIRDETKEQPCVSTITELANGTLRDFLKSNPSEEQLYSALFQVMVALHTVQLHGQIMNYDVKADNVLFYNVAPGGCWKYVVHGKDFFVPNYGQLFVLNDFGISRPLSPDFQLYRSENTPTFRLGSRYAIVENGKFSRLNSSLELSMAKKKFVTEPAKKITWKSQEVDKDGGVKQKIRKSKGVQFRLFKDTQQIFDSKIKLTSKQNKFLKKNNIPTSSTEFGFFLNPEIIPPFEFYNDLQDAVRIFIGGKRTTQRGDHRRYSSVTDSMYRKIKKYNGPGKSLDDRKFSTDPAQVLAGYFISDFFTKEHDYTTQPCSEVISTFKIS